MKPDIVFFGEALPADFSMNSDALRAADLVIILGTSLTVYPFAALPDLCLPKTPRLLFNLERVGTLGGRPDDVLVLGPCDAGVKQFAEELGWLDELNELWAKIVGDEEVARQRLRQESPAQDLKMLDEEIVESLLESVEGMSLKDYAAGKEQEPARARDPKKPSETGAPAEPSSIVLPKAIIDHLEQHLQDKITTEAKPGEDASGNGTPSGDKEEVEKAKDELKGEAAPTKFEPTAETDDKPKVEEAKDGQPGKDTQTKSEPRVETESSGKSDAHESDTTKEPVTTEAASTEGKL